MTPGILAGVHPARINVLVVHENREKKDDRKWDTDQPKQCASTETHDKSSIPLRCLNNSSRFQWFH
jgi:hypothetical protein